LAEIEREKPIWLAKEELLLLSVQNRGSCDAFSGQNILLGQIVNNYKIDNSHIISGYGPVAYDDL